MMKKIFISFKSGDIDHVNGFVGMLENPNNPLQPKYASIKEREDKRSQGEAAIKSYLKDLIKQCDLVVCLIGNDSHSSKWIPYEIDVAHGLKKKVYCVRIPETTGGPPQKLKGSKIYSMDEIQKELE